ncbi:MAG: hypothetical protein AABZ24_02105, partial [Nitrospirota bacterium]
HPIRRRGHDAWVGKYHAQQVRFRLHVLVEAALQVQPAKMAGAKQRVLDDMLLQKQQRALVSFQQSMKAKLPVIIRRELL